MTYLFSLQRTAAFMAAALTVLLAGGRFALAAEGDIKAVYLDEPESAPKPTVVGHAKTQEKYADGSVRVEREVVKMSDDQFINDGHYIEYYPNGKKFAEGDYVSGVHNGPWSFWHDNGQLAKTVNFTNGRADGAWEVHRADGTLESRKAYKNNVREGAWVVYYEDGKTPKMEQTYVEGKLQGDRKSYFSNGKVHQQANLKDGQYDGVVTEWDETGRKVAEAHFTEGKLNGTLTRWSSDGRRTEQVFRDNKFVSSKEFDDKAAPAAK